MIEITPIYTKTNCQASYELTWSLTLFWRSKRVNTNWLQSLKTIVEKDEIRILTHRNISQSVDQFLISTTSKTAPMQIIRSIKGRLQYLIKDIDPKAFKRNYSITSVGKAKRETIETYVCSQLDHHQMADSRVQESLKVYQIQFPEIDLSKRLFSNHGQYLYNLHIVFVNDQRWMEIDDSVLLKIKTMLLKASSCKGYLLSAAGILPDHIHMTIGCKIDESPETIALSYLNNLSYCQGMRPIYQSGYYVGTFGEYDLGAIK